MALRANIYRRLAVLHDEIEELKREQHMISKNERLSMRCRRYEIDDLQRFINWRQMEIDRLESRLIKDINPKTLHLSVVYEEELNFDNIIKNGIRGINL